jgi:hypothetical protein
MPLKGTVHPFAEPRTGTRKFVLELITSRHSKCGVTVAARSSVNPSKFENGLLRSTKAHLYLPFVPVASTIGRQIDALRRHELWHARAARARHERLVAEQ